VTETNRKKALGKGLEQLFSNEVINFNKFETEIVDEGKQTGGITEIPLEEIRSNPYQPRVMFDNDTLEELANSIKEHGIIQPIIVKKSIKGYELVAGERRTRAARLAGLKTIPAIIKDFNDVEMMEIALIENIERKFNQQEARIDELENKLERILSTLEEKDDMVLNRKVDKLENMISALGANIEKLASYVDEE